MADPPIIITEATKLPDFTQLNDLACQSFGSCILFATDDWFATAENLLKATAPEWLPDEFTEYGKWMDGWETRRKRIPGHDWCIIQLGSGGIIGGFDVDTSYFTGNFAPKVSIQGASLLHGYHARPNRKMGTAATEEELKEIGKLKSETWETILEVKKLGPGYKTSCHNFFHIDNQKRYTHLRLNIYPDGGVARLRVFGTVRPDWHDLHQDKMLDLVAMSNGGACVGYSNNHYGHPRNMIAPGRARIMAEGWETARRMDRPEILRADTNGALIVPGKEWAEFRLGTTGVISQIEIDTNHFKGNFPDCCYMEACLYEGKKDPRARKNWRILLPKQKLSAHRQHFYSGDEVQRIGPVNHVRVTIAPDGGISRLRLWGYKKTPSKL